MSEVMSISTPRKRDGDQRRRELCDAAIEVLAEHGSRGLTHAQVDRRAEVPDGTTSYYYRTREALVRGVGHRVAEIDTANLQSLTDSATRTKTPFGRLAQLVVDQADGHGLSLNKARLELLMAAGRDPQLAHISAEFVGRVVALTQDAIAQVAPGPEDADLRGAQTDAVMTFISGAFTRFAAGDRTLADADRIEALLYALVVAVAQSTRGVQ